MDIWGMIEELRKELDMIDQTILALQRFSKGQKRKRGRPPKWMKRLETRYPDAQFSSPEEKDAPRTMAAKAR